MKTFSTQTFMGGLVAGILLSVVWFYGNATWSAAVAPTPEHSASSTASLGTAALTSASTTSTSTSAVLSVPDQRSGDTVMVESVTVPPPGVWVAVREVSAGDLGNVLGAARAGGPRTNVTVHLLRATEPGRTYAAELYRPASATSSSFDLASSSVYVDLNSDKPVVVYFKAVN